MAWDGYESIDIEKILERIGNDYVYDDRAQCRNQ